MTTSGCHWLVGALSCGLVPALAGCWPAGAEGAHLWCPHAGTGSCALWAHRIGGVFCQLLGHVTRVSTQLSRAGCCWMCHRCEEVSWELSRAVAGAEGRPCGVVCGAWAAAGPGQGWGLLVWLAMSCRLAVVLGVDGGVGPSAFQQGVEFMRQGLAVAMSSWLVGVLGGGWAPARLRARWS